MLTRDPERRVGLPAILTHEWLSVGEDLDAHCSALMYIGESSGPPMAPSHATSESSRPSAQQPQRCRQWTESCLLGKVIRLPTLVSKS
jgi:hypothetical protein